MKAIMLMFDSLNRHFLPNYGCDWTVMPNFRRLEERSLTFDRFYSASLPCMPARRELHTGRYNFLHSSWSPLQPFDDSVISRLTASGVYTHIVTDHFHYWEDGGSCYLTKYNSHEMIRGQQGDPWKGQVPWPDFPDTLARRKTGENWRHDWVNRQFLTSEDQMPQKIAVDSGMDFIRRNCGYDNWFLQLELFDPHEPFYSQQNYKDLYPDDYHGKNLDWPDYGKNEYGEEATRHVRREYAALLSMCDHYLGKILDLMDEKDMWGDTMLIVNTDHGFMLGEKEWMGKNVQPMYEEISHIPFFIWDPRFPGEAGKRRKSLAQTIDIAPTLAEFFQIDPPEFMDGRSLTPIIRDDTPVREAALFGIFGGHVNVTDGRYVYMRAPFSLENGPFYEYTLMPCHLRAPFSLMELRQAELSDGFPYMKGCKVLKIPASQEYNAYWYGNRLYDLENDPCQKQPIQSETTELRLIAAMRELMVANEAPSEQFRRLGIPETGELTPEILRQRPVDSQWTEELPPLSPEIWRILLIIGSSLSPEKRHALAETVRKNGDKPLDRDDFLELLTPFIPPFYGEMRSVIKFI